MPDYSQFNALSCAAKISSHAHPDGSKHIEIDFLLPPEISDEAIRYIRDAFDQIIKKMPGAECISKQEWTGAEAALHDEPLTDYYERMCKRDFSHEN